MTWYVKLKNGKKLPCRTKENADMAVYAGKHGVGWNSKKYVGAKVVGTSKRSRAAKKRSRTAFGGLLRW